jgi:hypothetical protein
LLHHQKNRRLLHLPFSTCHGNVKAVMLIIMRMKHIVPCVVWYVEMKTRPKKIQVQIRQWVYMDCPEVVFRMLMLIRKYK